MSILRSSAEEQAPADAWMRVERRKGCWEEAGEANEKRSEEAGRPERDRWWSMQGVVGRFRSDDQLVDQRRMVDLLRAGRSGRVEQGFPALVDSANANLA